MTNQHCTSDDNNDDQCCWWDFDYWSDNLAVVWEGAPYFEWTAYQDWKFIELDSEQLAWKWVILFFYPADFTFVCPTELGELQDNYKKLQDLWAEVIAISTDTHFTHMWWAMSSPTIKKIKYPMLWDPTWETSMAYWVYQEESGLDKRWTFIIDPDGVIQAMEVSAEWLWRSTQEIIRKIEALQHMRTNPWVVCPNSWKKDWDLKPWEALVWKI
jgi:NADH-dependent peroxiredoxin subunit C